MYKRPTFLSPSARTPRGPELRCGLWGGGRMTALMIESLKEVEGIEAFGVCSRSLSKAQSFGLPQAYDDAATMLADPQIDLVYIALPNHLHAQAAKAALTARKHIVLEKPFTQSLEEAEALYALAAKQDCMLFEAIASLHMPGFVHFFEALAKIGRLRSVTGRFTQRSSRYDDYLAGKLSAAFDPKAGGGCLGDLNIYLIHCVVGLLGRPEAASYLPQKGPNGIDVAGLVRLRYGDVEASLYASKACDGPNELLFIGDQGVVQSLGRAHLFESFATEALGTKKAEALPDGPSVYRHEWQCFADCIRSKDQALHAALAAHSLQVMEIYAALKEGFMG